MIGYEPPDQYVLDGLSDGSERKARLAPLPRDMIEQSGKGTMSPARNTVISYYEADGLGEWRLCRLEHWWPADSDDDATRQRLRKVTPRYVAKNPILAKLPPGVMAYDATLVFYDKKGRIQQTAIGNFAEPERPLIIKTCYVYDDKDRVLLGVWPTTTKKCPSGEPDPRDAWKRYRYADYQGKSVVLLDQSHGVGQNGSWSEKIRFQSSAGPDGLSGVAEVDSVNGLTLIYGSDVGAKDNNSANMVVNELGHWNGSTYTFTKPPVPAAVLDNLDLLYKYERRRQTMVNGAVKMYELFPPNQHIARDRYYMIDSFVMRHEQLDAKGKVVRVITMKDWRQPHPGPNPAVDDKKLVARQFPLFHEIFHRVYDIDAKGNPKLVAISWNRERRLNPAKRVPLDMADLVYGTPDGKERWKTEAEFEKAFNTSAHANAVFPDNPRDAD
ncbi:hypothetical protein RugamoR57_21510 [Duganella caerulea]|uniref:hypothetical protein n=1 Tax=Duganella caerulea TaxID=2885762 RepID=UPI0030E842DC